MNLVFIPFHDWKKCEREGFRTRDAHFMEEFSQSPKIDKLLIVNRPTSLSEIFLRRNKYAPQKGIVIFRNGNVCITQVHEKTYTLDILIKEIVKPIIMQRNWAPYIWGSPIVKKAVNDAIDRLFGVSSYTAFISSPISVPLVKQLQPPMFYFDALDNFLKHSLYRNTPHLEEYYEYCKTYADLISTNSQETADWLAQSNPNVTPIPNGVDIKIMNPTIKRKKPKDLKPLSNPIVGYAGKMQEMFDVVLMEKLASEMPDINFVFIGQQLDSNWMKPLWKHPNAIYLGDKPYEQLPCYLAHFDICIIPYSPGRQHGGDPIKFYEYLAMGKPVVTTNIGNVHKFKDYPQVRIANTYTEFKTGIATFVDQIRSRIEIPNTPIPPEHLWCNKAAQIIQQIDKRFIEKSICV